MLTRHAVFRGAVAINHLLSEKSVALNGVFVPLAPANGIRSELNHANFRAKCFGVLDCPVEFSSFYMEATPRSGAEMSVKS